MPKTKSAIPFGDDLLSNGFKAAGFCIFSMFTFFVNNLNSNIKDMTAELRVMEEHQVKSDERIAEIEVSRKVGMADYEKVRSDVLDMKTTLIQLSMRVQTIADVVSKHWK